MKKIWAGIFGWALFSAAPAFAGSYSNGLTVASMDVSVSPRGSGVLKEQLVREGQWVEAGETLAVIDNAKELLAYKLKELQLDQSRLQLEKARIGKPPGEIERQKLALEKTKLDEAVAQKNMDRQSRLYEQKAISDQQMEDARAGYERAVNARQSAELTFEQAKEGGWEMDVKLAEMTVTQTQVELEQQVEVISQLTIFAPVAGFVSKLYFDPGEYVSPGKPFCDLLNTDKLYVELNLPVSQLNAVKTGSKATVTVPSVSERVHRGQVVFVSPSVDPASRTFKIRVEIENPNRQLKPGLFANVNL